MLANIWLSYGVTLIFVTLQLTSLTQLDRVALTLFCGIRGHTNPNGTIWKRGEKKTKKNDVLYSEKLLKQHRRLSVENAEQPCRCIIRVTARWDEDPDQNPHTPHTLHSHLTDFKMCPVDTHNTLSHTDRWRLNEEFASAGVRPHSESRPLDYILNKVMWACVCVCDDDDDDDDRALQTHFKMNTYNSPFLF